MLAGGVTTTGWLAVTGDVNTPQQPTFLCHQALGLCQYAVPPLRGNNPSRETILLFSTSPIKHSREALFRSGKHCAKTFQTVLSISIFFSSCNHGGSH